MRGLWASSSMGGRSCWSRCRWVTINWRAMLPFAAVSYLRCRRGCWWERVPSRAERLGRLLISACAVRTPERRHARSKWRGLTCQRQIFKRRHDRCAFLFDWRETISSPEGARPEPRGDCCAVSRSGCHDPCAHVISTIADRVGQFFANSVAARAWGALLSSSAFFCAQNAPVVGQCCRMRPQST